MTDFKNIKFGYKDVAGILILASMWYDLKTDFAVHREEHKLIEYRIASLENKSVSGIKPKQVRIENETNPN